MAAIPRMRGIQEPDRSLPGYATSDGFPPGVPGHPPAGRTELQAVCPNPLRVHAKCRLPPDAPHSGVALPERANPGGDVTRRPITTLGVTQLPRQLPLSPRFHLDP